VFVPNDGLRYVNENGAVVATLFPSGTGMTFALMDANGETSVALQSAVGQRFGFLGTPNGSELQVANQVAGSGFTLVSGEEAGLTLVQDGEEFFTLSGSARRTELSLASDGEAGLSFVADRGEGSLELLSGGSQTVELRGDGDSGSLTLKDSSARPRVTVTSDPPQLSLLAEDASTVWLAPPTGNDTTTSVEDDGN
jgi:hypothetical protein